MVGYDIIIDFGEGIKMWIWWVFPNFYEFMTAIL